MLVLSRVIGESVLIGENTAVTIHAVGNKIALVKITSAFAPQIVELSRDQEFILDGGVAIMVVDVRGIEVRLGITAPREIAVDREEVRRAKMNRPNRMFNAPGKFRGIPTSGHRV